MEVCVFYKDLLINFFPTLFHYINHVIVIHHKLPRGLSLHIVNNTGCTLHKAL